MKTLHILNLGAGVQSTVLYLMSHRRDEPEFVPVFDYAIFADTGEEPKAVYDHLAWLKSLSGPPIVEASVGKLGDDLSRGVNSTGQRFAPIPAYTMKPGDDREGQTRRQCTAEYKVAVVEWVIRRKILGLEPRKHVPKSVHIVQYMGLSFDEPGRIIRVKERFLDIPWSEPRFPLWDMEMTRWGCKEYLSRVIPGRTVERSACVFCPYRGNVEWRHLRETDPAGWARAIQVDEALRVPGAVVNRNFDAKLYVHRSCVPLRHAPIDDDVSSGKQRTIFDGFDAECEGMCGL